MVKKILKNVEINRPLIHCITNYVTVNDCANAILAIQGSPIMSDGIREVEEMVGVCSALLVNMGTLNTQSVESMIIAGKAANRLNKPVIFDPVGVGATSFRREMVVRFLNEIKCSVIKGNVSEIKFLAGVSSHHCGVDVSKEDSVANRECLKEMVEIARRLAIRYESIIVVTGAVDLVVSRDRAVAISNGVEMMSQVTGTGCMLGAILATLVATGDESLMDEAVTAVMLMGIAGEIAFEKTSHLGSGSFRVALIDALSQISDAQVAVRGRYELF